MRTFVPWKMANHTETIGTSTRYPSVGCSGATGMASRILQVLIQKTKEVENSYLKLYSNEVHGKNYTGPGGEGQAGISMAKRRSIVATGRRFAGYPRFMIGDKVILWPPNERSPSQDAN